MDSLNTVSARDEHVLSCFKAYDIRGRIPDQLNEDVAARIGHAFAAEFRPGTVVIGHDIRESSPALAYALAQALLDNGVDVLDIGLCGTEEVYFATADQGADGGIMVTASHNPRDYNGMKLVREGARPVSGDSGLDRIRDRVAAGERPATGRARGALRAIEHRSIYVEHLLSYPRPDALRPLKIVTDPGNGGAGLVLDAMADRLPFELVAIHHEQDGTFPNGIPNPLLPENREATSSAVVRHNADFGVAWDGDFDRCFFFDHNGRFIEGYYIVGLLARTLLSKWPGERIIHDPRLTWNTIDEVRAAGGIPVQSKTGHAFIKERMRRENALYGGEMSAHHYFRDFAYCDSGMIPWLLVAELIGRSGKSLAELVDESIRRYPASGEINRTVDDPARVLEAVQNHYEAEAQIVEQVDGLSMEFAEWRFNLRMSNTEPLLRLNVESRGSQALMEEKTKELLDRIHVL